MADRRELHPRTRRAAALLVAALAGGPGLARAEGPISVALRDPAILLVITPKGAPPRGDLLPLVDEVLRRHTDLTLRSPEQLDLDATELAACEGRLRLSCWLTRARPELEHPEHAGRAPGDLPRFLVVAAVHPASADSDVVSTMLLDLDRAAATYERMRDRDGGREEIEDRIFDESAVADTGTTRASEAREVGAFFEALLRGPWRTRLESAGRFEPFGAIDVHAGEAGLALELDGRAVGVTSSGVTELRDVRAGTHRIVLARSTSGGRAEVVEAVKVEPGQTAALITHVPVAGTKAMAWVRPAAVVTGLGLAVGGAALATWSATAEPTGEVLRVCRNAGCTPGGAAFRTPCDLSGDRTCLTTGGLLVAPLGYALATTGTTLATGTAFFDDSDVPWIPALTGVGAGLVAYLLSAALNPAGR